MPGLLSDGTTLRLAHFQTVKSAVASLFFSLFFSCSALVCPFSCSYITSQADLFIHMVLPTHFLIQIHTHTLERGRGCAKLRKICLNVLPSTSIGSNKNVFDPLTMSAHESMCE